MLLPGVLHRWFWAWQGLAPPWPVRLASSSPDGWCQGVVPGWVDVWSSRTCAVIQGTPPVDRAKALGWTKLGAPVTCATSQGILPKYGTGALHWPGWSSEPLGPVQLAGHSPKGGTRTLGWTELGGLSTSGTHTAGQSASMMNCAAKLGWAVLRSSGTCPANWGISTNMALGS